MFAVVIIGFILSLNPLFILDIPVASSPTILLFLLLPIVIIVARFEEIVVWKLKSEINPADAGFVFESKVVYPYISNTVNFVDLLPNVDLFKKASLSGRVFSSVIFSKLLSSSNDGYNRLKLPDERFQPVHNCFIKSINTNLPSIVLSWRIWLM